MPAGELDLYIEQGATYRKTLTWKTGSPATPVDLTGYTARLQVRTKIDDAEPIGAESLETLKGIAALTKMANASSEIGLNLLRANKENINAMNNSEPDNAKLLSDIASLLPD